MLVSEILTRFRGAVGSTPLQGIEPLDLLQAVLDDLQNEDLPEYLVIPAPAVTTVAGELTYSFDVDNTQGTAGAALPSILPAVDNIRRIRGLYKPALTVQNLADYNYRAPIPFDQNLIAQRLYEGGLSIDNERRLVTFYEDPDDTTDTWSCDYYEQAPTVVESDRLPVIHGWEMILILPGMRAFHEEWRTGTSGKWREVYEKAALDYRAAARVEQNLPRLDQNNYYLRDTGVEPQ